MAKGTSLSHMYCWLPSSQNLEEETNRNIFLKHVLCIPLSSPTAGLVAVTGIVPTHHFLVKRTLSYVKYLEDPFAHSFDVHQYNYHIKLCRGSLYEGSIMINLAFTSTDISTFSIL